MSDKTGVLEVRAEPLDEKEANFRFIIHLDECIGEPSYYRDVVDTLRNAVEDDEVWLIINSHGGEIDGVLSIIEALKATQAYTKAFVVSKAMSAAAYAAFACDEVVMTKGSFIMVHPTQLIDYHLNLKEFKDYGEICEYQQQVLLEDTVGKILTQKEIEDVGNGATIFLKDWEVEKRMGMGLGVH